MKRVDVMAGPRGRRLCLELVAGVARETGSPEGAEYLLAAVLSAYHLDPGAGTSVALMRLPGGGPDDGAEPIPTPADVARLVDALSLAGLTVEKLLDGVQAAVDSARYWQEPDGEDVLAASPPMRAALGRVADAVAASGLAGWWATPVERTTQAAVIVDDLSAPGQPASATLSRWREGAVEEEARARRDRPADPRAAWSGRWWSTPPRELLRTTRRLGVHGPAGLRWVEDADGWEQATVRPVDAPADAKVYEVDGAEAWSELCRRFPLEVTASRRHDWYRTTGAADRWVIPDWVRVAHELDAVHVTVVGYLSTAGRAVDVAQGVRTVLAGWNPDETCWLTDVPPGSEAPQRWHRLDGGTWREVPPAGAG